MSVTIRDIAAAAGTSVTTVSLVLNNRPNRISEETKARILKIAAELQYKPNKIAVSLVKKVSYTLGLIIPDACNVYFDKISLGVTRTAYKQDYSVFQCNIEDSTKVCIKYLEHLGAMRVDGLILIPPSDIVEDNNARILTEALNDMPCPIVVVDRLLPGFESDTVIGDNVAGAQKAVSYLIEHGHKRIGCIYGPKGLYSSETRQQGVALAHKQHNLPVDPELKRYGDYYLESGFKYTKPLLDLGVTAIFATNDLMAYGVMRYASENNISVPGDLSIIGYDNSIIGGGMNFGLTSVEQPAQNIGETACKMVISRFQADDPDSLPFQHISFAPKLVINETVAAIDND